MFYVYIIILLLIVLLIFLFALWLIRIMDPFGNDCCMLHKLHINLTVHFRRNNALNDTDNITT